jgi:putative flippase GtrA
MQRLNISPLQFRFLLIGAINTLIGYLVVTCLYYFYSTKISFFLIGVISNIINISIAFTLQKIFVFRTQGNWISEYLRSYITYGTVGILGFVLLWIFLNIFHLNIWISQGVIIAMMTCVSFIGHKKITFGVTK